MLAPHTRRRGLLVGLAAVVSALGLAGCGDGGTSGGSGASGASSPEAAVEEFLAPFSKKRSREQGAATSEEAEEFWASTCDRVDPRIRSALRFYEHERIDPRVNCGAAVVLLVAYTGDTGQMRPPSTMTGTPVSADTRGDTSIVSVDMRYESDERHGSTTPAPPPEATIKALVVHHDGSWWVATPQAFNPRHAAEGGLSESELRDQHEALLAAE